MRFQNKNILITGASSGIGAALALELARQGADLVLTARREDRLQALAKEIEALGRRAIVVAADVTEDGGVERAVGAAIEALGGVHIAIANAGFGVAGNAEKLTLADHRRQMETNVFGVLRTFYAALPELIRNRGSFVAIGSVSGHVPTPGTSSYCMSKFAVRGFMESIHPELRGRGVAVTLVSPGFVESEIRQVDNAGKHHEEAKDFVPSWLVMPAATAARKIARAIAGRRRELVLTGHGKAAVFLYRHFPWLVNLAVGLGAKKPRGKKLEAAPKA